MRLRPPRPTRAAHELFACACREAAHLSFTVGAEHLVLACALDGALDVPADDVRDAIVADERAALATLGISRDAVRDELADRLADHCLPVTPEAKRILELAARGRRVVTGDRLLAVLRDESPTAQRLLHALDV